MKYFSKAISVFFAAAAKKYWLAAGLILAIVGQALVREPQPLTVLKIVTEFSSSLNEMFYLALKNPANIMVGLFFIALASLIYGRLFVSMSEAGDKSELNLSNGGWLSWRKFTPWGLLSLAAYALVVIQTARHQYSTLLFGIWLISILLLTFIFWKNEAQNKTNPGLSTTHIDGIWMIVLFAFAIAAGAYLLNDMPAGWIPDEAPFWEMARSIALGETNPSFFDLGVFSFPIGSSILQAWIMRWAGINMWGWRFASVLPAAATVIPLYLLAHELFDRHTAITANVMMIVNPYFLTFARLGYNNSQSLFPVTLCIYFLVIGIRRNNRFYLWLAGLAAGLGFYTYFAAWLGLVVLVIVIMGLPRAHGNKFQKSIIPLAIILVGAFMVFLPRVLYAMSGDTPILLQTKLWETIPINTFYGRSLFGEGPIAQSSIFMVSNKIEVFYDLSLYAIIFLRGVILSIAVLFDPIVNSDHHIIFGLTGIGSSIFFILGLGVILSNFKTLRFRILSIWFLAGFFFLGALSSFPPRPTHLVSVIPALSLISAIGLISFLDAIISSFRWKKIAAASILLVITTISFFQFFFLTTYVYFPPNSEDYISWLGRQIRQPATIFLVDHYSIVHNPQDERLYKLNQHRAVFLTRSDLEADPSQMKKWKNFVAFVDLTDGREFAEWVAQKIPGTEVQNAYVPGERLRGYIITDLQINTSMDIGISHGLQDLWNSPARIIFISCGVGMIALLLKYRIK